MARASRRLGRKTHGVKSCNAVAVRWLGAYGRADSVAEMAAWEAMPGRQVACEIIPRGESMPGVDHVSVGLLVDQSRTRLVAAYAGDAWTMIGGDGHRLWPERRLRYVTRWDRVGSIARLYEYGPGGQYIEGTIERPVYTAVVVRHRADRVMRIAREVADTMGLPIVNLSDVLPGAGEAEGKQSRPRRRRSRKSRIGRIRVQNTALRDAKSAVINNAP